MKNKLLKFLALAFTCVSLSAFVACGGGELGNSSSSSDSSSSELSSESTVSSEDSSFAEDGSSIESSEESTASSSEDSSVVEESSSEDSSSEETSNEDVVKNGIAFNTLTVLGDEMVYGKVSNKTESFSFVNEVQVFGTAEFIVSLDMYGIQEVKTRKIPLDIGDNTVYITESIDGNVTNTYTVTVRRRPMHDVSFYSNGKQIETQIIEEDDFATEPTEPIRDGYTFTGWDYDFNKPITKSTEIKASWTANPDTPYKVEYYLQNLADDGYTLYETANKKGETDVTVNAELKNFTHFTFNESYAENKLSSNINPTGSTVLKVYYTRDKYTVTFDGAGGTLTSGQASQTVKYGGSVIAPTFEREGYTFTEYDKTNYTNISESFTITAGWKINQYTLTIVYGNGQVDTVITEDYATPIGVIENPTREYYEFLGWDKTMPATMPAQNLTITAKWKCIFTYSTNTITGLTAYGKANYEQIVLPSSIDGVAITAVASSAFYNCSSLTSIEIPNSVTSIGEFAFRGCSRLTEMTLPFVGGSKSATTASSSTLFGYIFGDSSYTDSTATTQYYTSSSYKTYYIPTSLKKVTITGGNILYGAFFRCSGLTSIVIPDSVTSIGNEAFYNCSSLTSIEIPNSVTSIGSETFYNCSSLTSITIPNSVTSIGEFAFRGCSRLTEMTLPFVGGSKSATTASSSTLFGYIFGDSSYTGSTETKQYYKSSSYKTYYIPTSLKKVTITGGNILYGAFYNCSGLTSIVIPDRVTSIGECAFYYCSGLTSIVIPDSVTSIGQGAFEYCSNLTSIVIPDSVKSIGEFALSGCSSLTSVVIPDSVTSIGSEAFYNCSSLTSIEIPNSVTSIGSYAFYGCSGLTSIVIPDSVTSIGYEAFYNCSGLTSIVIGDSVTSIGSEAFNGCDSLTSITVSVDNTAYKSIDGNLYTKDGKILIQYAIGKTATSFTIPDSVTSIGSYAFEYCRSLTSIVIPNSVTSIGSYAFEYCRGLTSIVIPNSVTSIGSYAFYNCYKLVEVINKSPYITVLKGNYINDGYIGYYALAVYNSDSGIEESQLLNDNGYIIYTDGEEKVLVGYTGTETDLTLPTHITKINQYAFYNCSSLTSVVIPDSVTSIGQGAFSGCSGLTEMTLPFVGGSKSATTASSSTLFGYIFGDSSYTGSTETYQYYTSSSYKTYYIPTSLKKVTIIGGNILYGAFFNCDSLTSIVIGDSVTSIGSSAFYYCTLLKSVVIGDSVTSIGYEAFYNCSSLTSITFADTSTWYHTTKYSNWNNKTGGTQTSVTTPSTNATYFKSSKYYWYKL